MISSRINHDKDERVIIEFDDTTRAWNDLKHGNIIQKSFVHERFTISLIECTKIYMTHNGSFENMNRSISSETIDIPSLVTTLPEININCHICRKYQGQLYPCRICGKVYHQQCIKDMGDTKSYHLIKNATNNFGWSCPICEDLRVLLSTEELAETNEWIKSLGSQVTFNLDNYINTRIKSKLSVDYHFEELYDHIKMILKIFLHTITDVTSNRLSQEDLLMLDVSMKIFRTSPKLLVNSLTSLELYRLSQFFISLSSTDNQYITDDKFHQVFNTYLLAIMPEIDSNEKHSHQMCFYFEDLEALAYSLLGNMINFDRTWTQFVLNATIPTLLGRYNYRTPFDFINRTVSIKRSTSPTTANLTEHKDNQSLATLINNILQKLKQTVGNETEPLKDQHERKVTGMKKRASQKIKH
ncbi:unnamed protein product [Rotaria sp. Silwood1]|nr:unnamed protein product [Rotaria sp. Silwood1]CAF4712972.1 unnamed protein product [Rotaria sp. Silwood1]